MGADGLILLTLTHRKIHCALIMSDDDENNTTVPYDVPVDITGEPITWDDNPASLAGILYEVGRFYQRKGLFQPLIKFSSVLTSRGKLAVDTADAVFFYRDQDLDPRDFEDPAPQSTERAPTRPTLPRLTLRR